MMCPVGLPDTIKDLIIAELKANWRSWLKFLLWEVPLGILVDAVKRVFKRKH